ncbi:MAG: cation:proton antiporter [Thermomicrobiales bacterium]
MPGLSWDVLGDVLVAGALVVLTMGVVGVVRMPNLALKLHAAGMMVVLGAVVIALASMATGVSAIASRGLLVAILLLLTTPVSAHAMAKAAWQRGELLGPETSIGGDR